MTAVLNSSNEKRCYTIKLLKGARSQKGKYFLNNIGQNLAFRVQLKKEGNTREELLKSFVNRYLWYRRSWRGILEDAIAARAGSEFFNRF
jgi:hypothetical protein